MNFPSVSQFSIAKGTGGTKPPEMYIPLWWYSGATGVIVGSGATAASSSWLIEKGNENFTSSGNSQTHLHTLNSSWSANIKFAFECTLWHSDGNSGTVYAGLWDITSGALVSGSQVSINSQTPTVLRSGQFTLTPSHVYGVALWNNATNQTNMVDASLIVFPS